MLRCAHVSGRDRSIGQISLTGACGGFLIALGNDRGAVRLPLVACDTTAVLGAPRFARTQMRRAPIVRHVVQP